MLWGQKLRFYLEDLTDCYASYACIDESDKGRQEEHDKKPCKLASEWTVCLIVNKTYVIFTLGKGLICNNQKAKWKVKLSSYSVFLPSFFSLWACSLYKFSLNPTSTYCQLNRTVTKIIKIQQSLTCYYMHKCHTMTMMWEQRKNVFLKVLNSNFHVHLTVLEMSVLTYLNLFLVNNCQIYLLTVQIHGGRVRRGSVVLCLTSTGCCVTQWKKKAIGADGLS